MKAKLHLETKQYLECPMCESRVLSVSHIKENIPFGPWYCDSCGIGIKGIRLENGEIEIEMLEAIREKALVLLELPPQQESIFLVVESSTIEPDEEEVAHQHKYLYEEHTCPTNYLRQAKEIKIGNDEDPHGLFQYKKTVIIQKPLDYTDDVFELFE